MKSFTFILLCIYAVLVFREVSSITTQCCLCDDFSSDPAQSCEVKGICENSYTTCPEYCETTRQFVGNKWFISRKCGQERTCIDHWYHTVTNLGCIDNTRGEPDNGTTCYKCCKVTDPFKPHFCLDNPETNYVTFPVTTPSTTQTTTPTTVTTTPTTTPTVTTTPTTTSTTTTPAPTTTSKSMSTSATCETCISDNCSVTTCATGEGFCKNTVIQHGNGTASLKKSCASERECYYDAYVGMKHTPGCGTSTTKAACHYCCQSTPGSSTPCNTFPIPQNVYNFGNNQGTLCEVGRDGSYSTKTCDASTPLCMNTVILQTNLTIIKKTCESDILCDQDWWKLTRARPECMKSDVTSLPVRDQGLVCHYCCKSSNGKTCNTETIPTDVKDIITRVDGNWSMWSLWQGCTVDCKGIRVRIRTCSRPFPSSNGRPCSGHGSETETCDATNCQITGTGSQAIVG